MNPASLTGHLLELLKLNDARQQPSDRLVATFFRERGYLGSADRRVISGYFFGIIRNRRYLEALLEQYVAEHPADAAIDHPHDRFLTIVTIFHHTLKPQYEIIFPQLLWKSTFSAVELTRFTQWLETHRALGFLGGDEAIRLGVTYSFQDWMVADWMEVFAAETEALLKAMNESARTTLRVNTLKKKCEECRDILASEGIESVPSSLAPAGLVVTKRFNTQASPAFKEGLFEMQDEGSQLVALLAGPKPGMTVIDACAGAGGKSLHLGALMENNGEIAAIDVDAKRLQELSRRAVRSGVTIIRTATREEFMPDHYVGKADIVLIDAPCTGSGTIRRNPWFKWTITESLVRHYSQMQAEIIGFNAQFVKGGGTLLYATCSLFRRENEEVVAGFLNAHHEFTPYTGEFDGVPGMKADSTGFVKLLPHVHGTDGFTICVLKRV